ncbi:hypothetical protein [Nocardia acidivorans]|uniref:hypothetical protein n=1 Tax=Nocardia acidivorans TaxID=404580 RepID=UPI0012F8AA17|nr:hypothetical protein [Nocardia acidivorans]
MLIAGCGDNDTANSSATTTTARTTTIATAAKATTTTPTPAITTSATAPAGQPVADELETFIRSGFGLTTGQPYSDLIGKPGGTWVGHITSISVDGKTAHVRMDSQTDNALGQSASKSIASLVRLSGTPLAHKLSTIIVEDETGAVLGQTAV